MYSNNFTEIKFFIYCFTRLKMLLIKFSKKKETFNVNICAKLK